MERDRTNKIRISQYDTATIDTEIWCMLKEGDTLYFGVYGFRDEFKDAFILKTASKESPSIKLVGEDTGGKVGRYRYQVKVQNAEGDIHTVQPETRFDIIR